MPVSGVTTAATPANGSLTNNLNAAQSQDEFLKLLSAQLQNQDPLNPVDNSNFSSQLAQFSTLQGIQTLNANFSNLLLLQQLTQGANLVGRTIVYDTGNNGQLSQGSVDAVSVLNGKLQVLVGGTTVPLENVRGFQQTQATTATTGKAT
jgi:flagellar basal-body rod modification protein FlgD